MIRAALVSLLLAGCVTPEHYYCKAGYAHTYSYNSGWKQVWSEQGGGVPCMKD